TSKDMYTITLGKGTYNENGLMYKGSATIRIVGSTDAKYGSDVIIKGHGSKMPGETGCDSKNRCLISIQGSANIILENLTLESDWYRVDHPGDVQAEVLGTDSTGYTAAYNCGFKSHQDTLRTIGKAWFYGCYIEGDVDFIWMEAGGKVALYENCEIVSVWDSAANTHNTYLTAPKMAETSKLGKGLVIFNSTVKESAEAKANGQKTYMARTPWSSGCYNQVAYINTKCEDIELSDGPWYKTQIATPFAKTTVGWKMDKATADSVGITEQDKKDYILDDATVAVEFNGRNAILNRVFDTGKLRYVTDTATNWDINVLIGAMGWTVTEDTSSDKLEGDTMGASTIYDFKVDGDNGAICDGFKFQDNNGNTHYVAQAGGTITIPVDGKCYIEVYGYYAGAVEATTDTQEGKMIMFFNNASTNSEVENDFIVYDENAKSFVLTAIATTYITKIVVTPDSGIEDQKVESLTITGLKPKQIVGVPQTLNVELGPKGVINTSVLWTSSDEEIATVDPYTGKITFLAEGKVTITATALDGSGVSASVECNPTIPNWTAIEWYTTDTTIATENGADGIDMFDVNNSANKKLSKSYTFTNLAGKKITSNYGFKLNSAGKLSFATLRYAEVSLIVAPQQNTLVNPPLITNADGSKAILLSQYVDETTGLQYYKYSLIATGMWDIERLDATMENNPILYAKVEYASDEITESFGVTFKGSFYTSSKTGIETIITPGSVIDANNTTSQFYKLNLTNCASNGNAENWLTFQIGAKIEFKVDRATTLFVGYYSKVQTVKLDGALVEGDKNSVSGNGDIIKYEIPAGGVVTIEATANDYLGFVGVLFKTLEQKKEDACSNLDKAYPANKYTQNADYEATLEAQKAAINAAKDEEALAAAIAAAKEALDALEKDPVVEYAETLNYVFASLANKPEDGTAVESTDVITFTNCLAHNGTYVALKNDNEVKIKIAAGSILTVAMPYSNGVTLNGAEQTLVDDKLVYTALENTEVTIKGAAGNAYIESIVITKAPKYAQTLNYVFASLADKPTDGTAVESTDVITFTNCLAHNGTYVALKNDNEVKIRVAAGSTVTVSMPYSSGVTLDGEAYELVDNKLVFTATENTEITIKGAAGNSYIESIV
ncbi:MAG: Ig-like domain-containing protein, partial [Anaeroplasmataceae bacterium]|nr:Ig-like domain-containing protein [Anaeroplasmataceae bacterium]